MAYLTFPIALFMIIAFIMNKPPLGFFFLLAIILGSILSIRNWPIMVEYGFSSIVYLLIVALIFFVPVSLVSAELSSGWPEKGGLYVWVKEALGKEVGFASVWFFWLSNVVWFPTVLAFIVSTLAYSLFPSLTPVYTIGLMLLLFWAVLLSNFLGIRYSGWFGALSLILGTLLPGAILIGFGVVWIFSGNQSHIDFSWGSLFPKNIAFRDLIFVFGLISSFAGMEMNAIHALDVQNPRKTFPKAIFISGIAIVILTLLGILSIGIAIPKEKIQLTTAVIEAISTYLNHYGVKWLLPFFSLAIAFGALGGLSNWLVGISKGLYHATENATPLVPKVNRHGVPTSIMLWQGVIVSVLSFIFIAMPSASSAFWLLLVLSSQLYLISYALMFISCIILRFKKPHVPRDYQISKGNRGVLVVAGIGFLAAVFAFLMGFVPPSQMDIGNLFFYEGFLILGLLLSFCLPLRMRFIYHRAHREVLQR